MRTTTPFWKVLSLAVALSCVAFTPPRHEAAAQRRQRPAQQQQPSAQPQAPTRGAGVVNVKSPDGRVVRLYEKSYALVIGVRVYTQGWPSPLEGVKKDIEQVARALEAQGFQVTKVEDPDSAQLEKSFREFINGYGVGEDKRENRLLFYFAGHGKTLRQAYGRDREMGYIVPSDAPLPDRDVAGFMSKAMDMQQMGLYARRIQSKHALFVFDSCFSGSIFSQRRGVPEPIGEKTGKFVRQFITSGSADEEVPDNSFFREQFVRGIEGQADLNPKDGYVTGNELGEFLYNSVARYRPGAQHPQYGKIDDPDLDDGDFVFVLRNADKAADAADAAPRPTPTPEPVVTVYDAAADFSVSANPNGAWSYGFLAAGAPNPATFKPYTENGTFHDYWARQALEGLQAWRFAISGLEPGQDTGLWVVKNVSRQTVRGMPPGQLMMLPGLGGFHSCVRWVAPETATYSVSAQFTSLNNSTTNVYVVHNTRVLFADSLSETVRARPFFTDLSVNKGDTLDFTVEYGPNKEVWGDETGLSARITRLN